MADKTTPVEATPVVEAPETVERPACACELEGTCSLCKDNYCQGCGKYTPHLDA